MYFSANLELFKNFSAKLDEENKDGGHASRLVLAEFLDWESDKFIRIVNVFDHLINAKNTGESFFDLIQLNRDENHLYTLERFLTMMGAHYVRFFNPESRLQRRGEAISLKTNEFNNFIAMICRHNFASPEHEFAKVKSIYDIIYKNDSDNLSSHLFEDYFNNVVDLLSSFEIQNDDIR